MLLAILCRHIEIIRDVARPQRRAGMHVEGKCRCTTPAPHLSCEQGIIRVLDAEPAERLRHRHSKDSSPAHIVIIFERERGLFVIALRPADKFFLAERSDDLLDLVILPRKLLPFEGLGLLFCRSLGCGFTRGLAG